MFLAVGTRVVFFRNRAKQIEIEGRKDRGKEDLGREIPISWERRGAFDVSPFFMAVDDSVEKRR